MTQRTDPKPEPHPGIAGLAIAMMGLVLAWMLDYLGVLKPVDHALMGWVNGFGLDGANRVLDGWVPWSWAGLMTVGVCQAVVHVRGMWRRLIIVVSAMVLTLTWIPVLALAAFHTPLTGSMIALIWGGVGSLVYAERHREPD
ncbi:hypothetical protein [Haloferula rosea]|uniref:Uncharacterized protein n=1 Tax=Haloferula rosea TaxID=490093 RepID=A0A934REL2_9BACT|nr:hypothetical protein [Haloferula rosea]MBK1827136.1 hypothetical protein [Haloferula rosea]